MDLKEFVFCNAQLVSLLITVLGNVFLNALQPLIILGIGKVEPVYRYVPKPIQLIIMPINLVELV